MEVKEVLEVLKTHNDKCSGCDRLCDDLCKPAIEMAISALEKQMPKKPVMKQYYEDMEEEYLCCPTCGDILTDRIPMDNKDFYFHCLNCGQKLDWSDNN